MNKTALVTGATDGIGRATALELARQGYVVHVLGRNPRRGTETLTRLRAIHPEGKHELFMLDLGTLEANNRFLQHYRNTHDSLDLLVLNANAATKPLSLTKDGIETTFAVGYISRYLFSLKLNDLLVKGDQSRVVHIGDAVFNAHLDYDRLFDPQYGIAKATWLSYTADALLVHFLHECKLTPVAHELMNPGVVNTRQVQEQHRLFRLVAHWFGMIEPEEAGRRLVRHIGQTSPSEVAGRVFKLEKPKKGSKGGAKRLEKCQRLIEFSESFTGTKVTDYLKATS